MDPRPRLSEPIATRVRRLLSVPRGFRQLWLAQSVSLAGDQVTLLALPTLAILDLGLGPLELSVLGAAAWLPWAVLALPAGVLVDRLDRRRLLIVCDLARLLALLTIPLVAATGGASFGQLVAVALAAGVASMLFELAFTSHVPERVAPPEIPRANAVMEASRATSFVAGPGIAGLLIATVGPAIAVLIDAASFAISAIVIAAAPAVARTWSTARSSRFREDLAEGIGELRRQPILLRMTLAAAISNFGLNVSRTVLLLYLYEDLLLTTATVGFVLAAPGLGALLGVAFANRLANRLGVGNSLLVATLIEAGVWLAIPLAPLSLAAPIAAVALAVSAFWGVVWNVIAVSVRQVAVAPELQGRVASIRGTIGYAVIPLGAIAGGVLATALAAPMGDMALGVTLGIGAAIAVSSGLPLLRGDAVRLRRWRFADAWPP